MGEKLILFKVGLFSWIQDTHVSLERKHSVVELGESSTLFASENWVGFVRNASCPLGNPRGRNDHFLPNTPIQLSWRNTTISRKKSIFLKGKASSTFFPCEHWVRFWKKTSCYLGFSRWWGALFFPNRHVQLSWRNTCICQNKKICVRRWTI
jgi:hypothetical protein